MSKALKDSFRTVGYSSEEAYFFEQNRQNLIDFKAKQKEFEERKKQNQSRKHQQETNSDGNGEHSVLEAKKKAA